MTRVWLNDWEWACCGRPFAVGDEVDFAIRTRTPDPFLTELLGQTLAATVDAVESHHEESTPIECEGASSPCTRSPTKWSNGSRCDAPVTERRQTQSCRRKVKSGR
jgi:hypothetical protein